MVKWGKLALQFLVSGILLVYALRQIDLEQVKLLSLQPHGLPWLIGAIALFNISKIVSALRLNVYQRHANISINERENLKLYYAGMFFNQFLPGGIGGDGYKILVLLSRQAASLRKLVAVMLADRVSGLMILLLLLCLLVPVLPLPWPKATVDTAAIAGGMSMVVCFLFWHSQLLKINGGGSLAALFGYGTVVQLSQLGCMLMLLAWLQAPETHFLAYLAVFLVSSVAAVMPLSFGGLGAREITFFYCLSMMQLEPTHGIIASSAFFLITLMSSLLGALFLGGFSLKRAQSSQDFAGVIR